MDDFEPVSPTGWIFTVGILIAFAVITIGVPAAAWFVGQMMDGVLH